MELVVERCAGLDVHKDLVVACVRVPRGRRRAKDRDRELLRLHRGLACPA